MNPEYAALVDAGKIESVKDNPLAEAADAIEKNIG